MSIQKLKFSTHILALLLITAVSFAAPCMGAKQDEVIIRTDPASVIVGEPAEFRLISIAGFVELDRLPIIPGLRWESNQPLRSKRTIVTKRITTFNTVYNFTVNKEGPITIPAMKVKVGHKVIQLKSYTFKAYKQKLIDSTGKAADLDELLYVSAVLLNDRNQLYLGEEVPLEIRMYSVRGLPVSCSWPSIDVENVVLRNYGRNVNAESPNFIPPVRRTVKLENQLYNVDIFKTALRAISPGYLKGKITIPCNIKIQRQNNQKSGDPLSDFFSSPYRTIQYKLATDLPDRKVIPLPSAPSDSIFLGLVGDWDINMYLSSQKLKSGDPVTLRVTVSGTGTLDTLTAPELKLPGFMIYPPEVKKGNVSIDGKCKAEIRYAMIPREEGPVNIELNFSSFSPKDGKYIEKKYNRNFNVKKGENGSSLVDDSSPLDDSSDLANNTGVKNKIRHGILYLKRQDTGGVTLPLYKNKLLSIIFFFLIGPLVLAGMEFYFFKHGQLKGDPLLRRKSNAKKRKSRVIDAVTASPEEEMHNVIQNDVTPYLNDLLGYPPGTSAAELADKVKDAELAECLHSGSASSYMPGASHADPKTLKQNLLKALQKISIIAVCFISAFTIYGQDINKTDDKKIDINNPLTAYDTGHFQAAEKYYQNKLNPKHPDPAVLYNLGNCLFQQGKFPEALVCYERARRLDPTDSDITENLNYIRRKLMLPELGKAQNPLDSLRNFRDEIRPDTWLLFAAITWSLCWVAVLLRRYLSVRKWISGLAIYFILFAISIFAYISQMNTTYSPKTAVVLKKGIQIYSLPTTTSRKSEFNLRPGAEIRIEEERHNWVRIRDDQSEGWIKSDAVKKLWPY